MQQTNVRHHKSKLFRITFIPLLLIISAIFISTLYSLKGTASGWISDALSYTPNISFILGEVALLLLGYNILSFLLHSYTKWYTDNDNQMVLTVFGIFRRVLRVTFVLITLNIVFSSIDIPDLYQEVINKTIYSILIGMAGWLFIQLLTVAELWFSQRWIINNPDETYQREQATKIKLLKRILVLIVSIFTAAAILMLFDYMRNVGVSLLASAGVISTIIGLAANKPLSAMFTGFQLAFSQPVKIDDVVTIEGNFGTIEEITMSYVVVKLWDSRRMVVPLNYFLDKPLENWSYKKTNLLGTFYLYTDFKVPVEQLRQELKNIIMASPLWDKETWGLHVTDFQERSVQLRVIISAKNPGDLWALRADIREQLITYINKNFPESWPKNRNINETKLNRA